MKISAIQNKYEEILHSEEEDDMRSLLLGKLMTNMEIFYHIPIFCDEGWEKKNQTVLALFRKISSTRNLYKSVLHFRKGENAFKCILAYYLAGYQVSCSNPYPIFASACFNVAQVTSLSSFMSNCTLVWAMAGLIPVMMVFTPNNDRPSANLKI